MWAPSFSDQGARGRAWTFSPRRGAHVLSTAKIRSYSFDEFLDLVATFHGFAAPGVVIGGFMVEAVYRHLPEDGLFDALCETPKCLPDAIQLLTPCTVGNGWLTVVNMGRYALALYDKETGQGARVFVDSANLEAWPAIKNWFFKLMPKKESDSRLLMEQIRDAGPRLCGVQRVKVADRLVKKQKRGGFALCAGCGESHPSADGQLCRACGGEAPYESLSAPEKAG